MASMESHNLFFWADNKLCLWNNCKSDLKNIRYVNLIFQHWFTSSDHKIYWNIVEKCPFAQSGYLQYWLISNAGLSRELAFTKPWKSLEI